MRNVMDRPNLGLKAVMLKRGLQAKRVGASALMRLSRLRALQEEIDLSDDQVRQLWDIESNLVRTVAKLTLEIRVSRFDCVKGVAIKPVNFDQVRANTKRTMDLRTQRKIAIIDAFEEGLKVLTPDQKEELPGIFSFWEDEIEEDYEDDQE